MTQSKRHKDVSPAPADSKRKGRLVHWMRVAVMFLSGGFIFPHAMTENMEVPNEQAGREAKTGHNNVLSQANTAEKARS